MVEHDALSATREAYDAAAASYAQLFRDTLRERPLDRAILSAFAEVVRASGDSQVADLGCGPGYVTAHLDELGLAAFGVDASPAMIELARQAYPGLRFDVGSMAALNIADGVLGGVLSRWSVIHTPPGNSPSSWRSSTVCWRLAATFWSAFRQAMTRLTRRRSSIMQSYRPIGGRLITSPRCCARRGWPRWPGWFASLSPPTDGSSRRFNCSPARSSPGRGSVGVRVSVDHLGDVRWQAVHDGIGDEDAPGARRDRVQVTRAAMEQACRCGPRSRRRQPEVLHCETFDVMRITLRVSRVGHARS